MSETLAMFNFGDERVPSRVWKRIRQCPNLGCWLFEGAPDKDGYGKISVNGKTRRAHRAVYEWLCGQIGESLVTDHLCRVRQCVNPAHLEPVTSRTNTMRGDTLAAENAEKTYCKRGHAFDDENVYANSGRRHCRECKRAEWRESHASEEAKVKRREYMRRKRALLKAKKAA